MIPPAFWSRYRGFAWGAAYRPLLPLVVSLGVFFIAHSAVPHKEPRFMIPILPLFFVGLAPLAEHLLQNPRRSWVRLFWVAANALLLFLLTFFTFQNNMIGLVRYLGQNETIERLTVFEDSMTHFPFAYSTRGPLTGLRMTSRYDRDPASRALAPTCDEVLVVRANLLEAAGPHLQSLHQVAVFHASPLERLALAVNPQGNKRRGAMHVYMPAHCEAP